MTVNKNKHIHSATYLLLLGILTLLSFQAKAEHPVDFNKELIIRDISVVNDALRTTYVPFDPGNPDAGAWSFGRLMENLAPDQDVSAFVLNWLESWESDGLVNGDTVEARGDIRDRVIQPWLDSAASGTLNMAQAPFRLLSIVNRIDLRRVPDSSLLAGHAGEGRFIFGVLAEDGSTMPFTVILEYELLARTVEDVQAWSQQWHALGELPFGEDYNLALRQLTDLFTLADIAGNKVNGSAINQVRTNEIALFPQWELREFALSSETGNLVLSTVKQTPREEANGTRLLANFINRNEAAILNEEHVVPNIALAGHSKSSINPLSEFTWNAAGIINPEARHKFALNTCSGCHSVETNTIFLHVSPRNQNQLAPLSPFLSGAINVNDPAGSGQIFVIDEPQRRIDDLTTLLDSSAAVILQAAPLNRVH